MNLSDLRLLQTDTARRLIAENAGQDPAEFALSQHDIPAALRRAVAEQLACRKKAALKVPSLRAAGVLFDTQALEQCSGEAAARYKASFMRGGRLFDATGGQGADAVFVSGEFTHVVCCEKDEGLAALLSANLRLLDKSNIDIRCGDGSQVLAEYPDNHFDWLYVDPSRRTLGRRQIALGRSEPDPVKNMALYLRKARRVCVKASPMLEVTEALRDLPNISEMTAVSYNGECKELLLVLDPRKLPPAVVRRAAVLSRDPGRAAIIVESAGALQTNQRAGPIATYFYDADPALTKMRLAGVAAERHGLVFVNRSVDYTTSKRLATGFPGRALKVVSVVPWNRRTVASYLRTNGIIRANVARRDFPLSPERIHKLLSLGDGGSEYVFFTKDTNEHGVCIHCRRVGRSP